MGRGLGGGRRAERGLRRRAGPGGRHAARVHGRHAAPQQLLLLHPLLDLLLLQLLLDAGAERHRALGLLAMLRVVAAQRDQLLADGAVALGLALADLGVRDDALHLLAGREAAVRVAALAGVDEGLDAPLDGQLAGFLRVGLFHVAGGGADVQVEPQLLHLVRMALLVVAGHAEIEVVADGAMVARLDVGLAAVAGVDELVLALVVQLVQHAEGGEARAPRGRELVVAVARHRQERVAAVHQVAVHQRVRVRDRLQQ